MCHYVRRVVMFRNTEFSVITFLVCHCGKFQDCEVGVSLLAPKVRKESMRQEIQTEI